MIEAKDPLFVEAKEACRKQGFVTVSRIQRVLRIGFSRAARLVDLMIEDGFCEKATEQNSGHRKIIEDVK